MLPGRNPAAVADALVTLLLAHVIVHNAHDPATMDAALALAERLANGGRLILPMTSDQSFAAKNQGSSAKSLERIERAGAVFRIERSGEDYLARWISGVAIFPCAGNRDEVSERALADSFAKGGWQKVTRLYRNQEIPEERCWVRGSGWCLAYS